MTPLLAIRAALSNVPWQVWIAAAFLALLPLSYCKGRSDGRAVVYAKLEKAQDKAEAKAEKAADAADANQQKAADVFEIEQDVLRKAIDDAKAEDVNALDAIF